MRRHKIRCMYENVMYGLGEVGIGGAESGCDITQVSAWCLTGTYYKKYQVVVVREEACQRFEPLPVTGSWHGAHFSRTLPIWYPFLSMQVLDVQASGYKEFQEIRRRERVACIANQLTEARSTVCAVAKSGAGLGCIAIGKNSFGGYS